MDCVVDRFVYPLKNTSSPIPQMRRLLSSDLPCLFHASPRGRRAAVFLHGNSCTLADVGPFVDYFAVYANCDVVCMTYPGYPGTDRSCLRGSAYDEEIAMSVALAARELSSKYSHVYVMAHSLGCAAALRSMLHFTPSGGLVLLSPFKSLRSAARHHFGDLLARLVPESRMNNVEQARYTNCDVLMLHGLQDDVVLPNESLTLQAALHEHSHGRRVNYHTFAELDHCLSPDYAMKCCTLFNIMWPIDPASRKLNLQFR